jgi:pyruvate carboxylase
MFSRRAREYMVAYNAIDNCEDEYGDSDEKKDEKKGVGQKRNPLMTAYLIEKIVKLYKTHRSAADFDCGFVSRIVNTMKGIKNGVEGSPNEY